MNDNYSISKLNSLNGVFLNGQHQLIAGTGSEGTNMNSANEFKPAASF